MPKKKNFRKTRFENSLKYGGLPSEMPSADLPTFRQVIQFFYYTENKKQNISKQNLLEDVENSLTTLWNKVNPRLPLVQRNSILRKLRNLFERVKSINRGRNKSKSKEYQDLILDKLFDISSCTCELATVLCNDRDVKCSIIDCQIEHILCLCKTRKIPSEDRAYIRDQRNKIGPKGIYQLGKTDLNSGTFTPERLVQVENVEHIDMPDVHDSLIDSGHMSEASASDPDVLVNDSEEEYNPVKSSQYNLMKLDRFAMEAVRYDVSSRAAAALANALLLDYEIIKNGDLNQVVDRSKIEREKKKVMSRYGDQHDNILGIKVISNAGGINPISCAKALQTLCKQHNIELSIAVITGDDLMPRLKEIKEELATQLPKGIHSMNAYLGAGPIARALDLGADVVITGRCVDSAVTLAPLIHTFDWKFHDYDLLAAGSLAGHLIECGAQVTGGIFTDWQSVPRWDDIGFPIVECYSDGEFLVTKPRLTGGLISKGTVSEQIVYEIGDPDNYMLPDVTCSFSEAKLTVLSGDDPAVIVTNVYGKPPSSDYKVSATYMDGFRATAVCPVVGPKSSVKGERVADAIIKRCRRIFQENGLEDFSKINVELLGTEDKYNNFKEPNNNRDVVLWLAVQHRQKEALEIFAREIAPAGTGMAPGLTAIVGGRPTVSPVLKLYSFQYPKEKVEISIHLNGVLVEKYTEYTEKVDSDRTLSPECVTIPKSRKIQPSGVYTLGTLAYTRSGDKGNNANIGVICREEEYYPYIKEMVTPEAVEEYFKHFFEGTYDKCRVKRYELPGIFAFNFVLEDVLGGGGVASLRSDPQGKGLGQMLLDFKLVLK